MNRRGLTLIELVVVMAVVALLIALLLPAIGSVREAARRAQCRANLQQIGLALHSYESDYRLVPAAITGGWSWHVSLLPYIEQKALYDRAAFVDPAGFEITIQDVPVPLYLCPSDNAEPVSGATSMARGNAGTSYLGCSGTGALNNGFDGLFTHFTPYQPDVFPGDGPVRLAAVTDGLSQTAFVGEVLHPVIPRNSDRLRTTFNTPREYSFDEIDEFRRVCRNIPDPPASAGWMGPPHGHGLPWTWGSVGFSTYNHMLTPQQPSCINQTHVPTGIFTSGSQHAGLVHVLFVDGHVQSVNWTIDTTVWTDMGSRSGPLR